MRECRRCGATYGDDVLHCAIDGVDTTQSMSVHPQPPPGDFQAAPKPGDKLGSYVVQKLIGVGGMGLVYLGEHVKLSRKVALKLLRPEFARDPVAIRRFFAEARVVNEIAHEHIVEITDFVDEGSWHYFVMELLRGRALHEVIKADGRFPLARALHVSAQIASALAAAHDAHVIHRDVKPQNVFLIDKRGDPDFVKVLDFGIAKARNQPTQEQTAAGTFVGTPAYMAPEQLSEKPVDHRADIYSFGILLFELVTGTRPFKGAGIGDLIVGQLTKTAPPLTDCLPPGHAVPPQLVTLVRACLEKEPDRRPASMSEVHAVLRELERNTPALPPLPRANEPADIEFAVPASGGWVRVGADRLAPAPMHAVGTESLVLGEVDVVDALAADEPLVVPRDRRPLMIVGAIAIAVAAFIVVQLARTDDVLAAVADAGALPTTSALSVDAPVESAHVVGSAPIESAHVVGSAPIENAPIESAPIASAPIKRASDQGAPVKSAPLESTSGESVPDDGAALAAALDEKRAKDSAPKPARPKRVARKPAPKPAEPDPALKDGALMNPFAKKKP